MASGGEVDADLVRASGEDADAQKGAVVVRITMKDAADRVRGTSVGRSRVECADSRVGDVADRSLNVKPIGHVRATGEGAVDLLDATAVQVLGERSPGLGRTGEEHDSRGGAADAVDWSGGWMVVVASPDEGQQGVFEAVAAGKHGQTGRFGDGEDVPVLVKHGEGPGHVGFAPWGPVVGKALAAREDRVGERGTVVQAHDALRDPFGPRFRRGMRIPAGVEVEDRFALGSGIDPVGVGPSAIGVAGAIHECRSRESRLRAGRYGGQAGVRENQDRTMAAGAGARRAVPASADATRS